jgi:hypothetical protein
MNPPTMIQSRSQSRMRERASTSLRLYLITPCTCGIKAACSSELGGLGWYPAQYVPASTAAGSIIEKVLRQVRRQEDAERQIRKLMAAAKRGRLDAAALLLLADDRVDRPCGVAAVLRSEAMRESRPQLVDLLKRRQPAG